MGRIREREMEEGGRDKERWRERWLRERWREREMVERRRENFSVRLAKEIPH